MANKRKDVLEWMKAAGAQSDKATFTRLFCENRVSLESANQAWRDGANFARFVHQRDANKVADGLGA